MKNDKNILDTLCSSIPESRDEERLLKLAQLTCKTINNTGQVVFKIIGDAMDDNKYHAILDQDLVVCTETSVDNELPFTEKVFLIMSNKGNVVRQIMEVNKEKKFILCHAFNPAYSDFKISFKDIGRIFIVDYLQRSRVRIEE